MMQTEQELFNYIKGRYLEDLTKTSDQYEYHDATSTLYRLHIELKCRHTHYDNLLIEQEKYDALMQQAERLGFTPFYVNATPKGIYAFNLNKTKITWTVKIPLYLNSNLFSISVNVRSGKVSLFSPSKYSRASS